jgi:hypothetical protein
MWRVFSASTTGKRNLDEGAGGQDASHWIVTGDRMVAVVCDGAGSVREGRAGSDFMARALAEELERSLQQHALAAVIAVDPGSGLESTIRGAIETVPRGSPILRTRAASRSTIFVHARRMRCVAGGGCFFHIGDGFAIQQTPAGDSVLSQPENGEYADETYFVTDENWQTHLRLTTLPAPERGCRDRADVGRHCAVRRQSRAQRLLPPVHRPDRRVLARGHGA